MSDDESESIEEFDDNPIKSLPSRNTFYFQYEDQQTSKNYEITFTSDFDSGNCGSVTQISPKIFEIYTAPDCAGTPYEGRSKSWFYFKIKGFPRNLEIKLIIKRLGILWTLFKNAPKGYKPVIKIGNLAWQRYQSETILDYDTQKNELVLTIPLIIECNIEEWTSLAFNFPFSYEECCDMTQNWEQKYSSDNEIYFNREILINSPQNRKIEILTISSHDGKLDQRENYFHDGLFPNKKNETRPYKFKNSKTVIFLSARVHPAESNSSYVFRGCINFLLDKEDVRAHLLRKSFVFKLVPMLNPDGVYCGHFRMDAFNKNLNRYYNNPDPVEQPAIFGVVQLLNYLHNDGKRLFFYCDMHGHASNKGSFLYGNAIKDFVKQVENVLFSKILAQNCINFEQEQCNFSKKHMKCRDKGEKLTKEGCGRVFILRTYDLIHCYTLETSFFPYKTQQLLSSLSNSKKVFFSKYICKEDDNSPNLENFVNTNDESPECTIEIYENLGKSLLISILDIFNKNPCSRICNSEYQSIEIMRTQLAKKLSKYKRFKIEAHTALKTKKINELINEQFYQEFQKNCNEKQKLQISKSKQLLNNERNLENSSRGQAQSRNFSIPQSKIIPAINKNQIIRKNISEQNDFITINNYQLKLKTKNSSPSIAIENQYVTQRQENPLKNVNNSLEVETLHFRNSLKKIEPMYKDQQIKTQNKRKLLVWCDEQINYKGEVRNSDSNFKIFSEPVKILLSPEKDGNKTVERMNYFQKSQDINSQKILANSKEKFKGSIWINSCKPKKKSKSSLPKKISQTFTFKFIDQKQ